MAAKWSGRCPARLKRLAGQSARRFRSRKHLPAFVAGQTRERGPGRRRRRARSRSRSHSGRRDRGVRRRSADRAGCAVVHPPALPGSRAAPGAGRARRGVPSGGLARPLFGSWTRPRRDKPKAQPPQRTRAVDVSAARVVKATRREPVQRTASRTRRDGPGRCCHIQWTTDDQTCSSTSGNSAPHRSASIAEATVSVSLLVGFGSLRIGDARTSSAAAPPASAGLASSCPTRRGSNGADRDQYADLRVHPELANLPRYVHDDLDRRLVQFRNDEHRRHARRGAGGRHDRGRCPDRLGCVRLRRARTALGEHP